MDALSVTEIKGIVARISDLMDEKKEELIRLDGLIGDGDLGLTMATGFRAARDEAESSTENDAGKLLARIGMSIGRSAPSTMGTLVATGFMSGGKVLSGKERLDATDLASFFGAFTDAMMRRGKSKPGEKTLIDVFYPAAEAMKGAAERGASLADCSARGYEAAEQGHEESKGFVAQHGRAAYYREKSRGMEDPGTAAALFIIQGFDSYIRES